VLETASLVEAQLDHPLGARGQAQLLRRSQYDASRIWSSNARSTRSAVLPR
jgi:hypothetical protein